MRNPDFPTVHRNLAIAYFNKHNWVEKAVSSFEKAFELDKTDARVLIELDQLYKRINKGSHERLKLLEDNLDTALQRDDLYLERAALYNFQGEFQKAYDLIMARQFHPWEGGEGRVSGQYIYALVEMAKQNIETGDIGKAIEQLGAAQIYPHNLGEGKLYGAQENDIFYWLGVAYETLGEKEKAKEFYHKATQGLTEPGAAMFYNDQQPDKIFYQGLAWRKLGEEDKAKAIFENLYNYGTSHMDEEAKIDYFAVSLPNLLIFEDDLQTRHQIHCLYISALGLAGLSKTSDSENALREILKQEAMHFGAQTHLALILNNSINWKYDAHEKI